jgi:hypothetical protein
MMLFCSLMAMLAALYVFLIDQRERRDCPNFSAG